MNVSSAFMNYVLSSPRSACGQIYHYHISMPFHTTTNLSNCLAPNGLCLSITESKHINSIKEPWCRSSHFKALAQMLCSIIQMEKMAVIGLFTVDDLNSI